MNINVQTSNVTKEDDKRNEFPFHEGNKSVDFSLVIPMPIEINRTKWARQMHATCAKPLCQTFRSTQVYCANPSKNIYYSNVRYFPFCCFATATRKKKLSSTALQVIVKYCPVSPKIRFNGIIKLIVFLYSGTFITCMCFLSISNFKCYKYNWIQSKLINIKQANSILNKAKQYINIIEWLVPANERNVILMNNFVYTLRYISCDWNHFLYKLTSNVNTKRFSSNS